MPVLVFSDSIYKIKITFICFESEEKVVTLLLKETKIDYSEMLEKSGGFFCAKDNFNYFIVIMTDKDSWESVIAHEALHVTSRALRVRGIKLTTASEEAFTYFLAYIVEQCCEFYKKNLNKRKLK